MNDQRLIKLVRCHEFLYSKNNKNSKSFEKKEAAWQRIADDLGASKSDCMRRWTHLRNRYSKESRRITMLEKNGLRTSNSWSVFSQLKFLKPHIIPRRKRLSLSSSCFLKDEKNGEVDFKNASEKLEIDSSSSPLSEQEIDDLMQSESVASFLPQPMMKSKEAVDIDTQNFIHSTNFASQQVDNEIQFRESDVDRDLKNIAIEVLKLVRDTTQSRHKNPAVYGFGQMIVETICSMNERKQAIAMQKMTEIAMKLKIEPDN